ncbi:hypothetical protein KEM56_003986 [Ascosphaera pollenicola]|nr:hypothetical protein KEM56_003986 [Ascosphaera pollenicola]
MANARLLHQAIDLSARDVFAVLEANLVSSFHPEAEASPVPPEYFSSQIEVLQKAKLIFAPLNYNKHWALAVIDTVEHHFVLGDSACSDGTLEQAQQRTNQSGSCNFTDATRVAKTPMAFAPFGVVPDIGVWTHFHSSTIGFETGNHYWLQLHVREAIPFFFNGCLDRTGVEAERLLAKVFADIAKSDQALLTWSDEGAEPKKTLELVKQGRKGLQLLEQSVKMSITTANSRTGTRESSVALTGAGTPKQRGAVRAGLQERMANKNPGMSQEHWCGGGRKTEWRPGKIADPVQSVQFIMALDTELQLEKGLKSSLSLIRDLIGELRHCVNAKERETFHVCQWETRENGAFTKEGEIIVSLVNGHYEVTSSTKRLVTPFRQLLDLDPVPERGEKNFTMASAQVLKMVNFTEQGYQCSH